MRLAYLINQYPAVSHSFIRREILALERRGHDVLRIAVRGWDKTVPDADDRLERTRTRYLLQGGAPALIRAMARMLAKRPAALFGALALTFAISRRAERPLAVHLVYLGEACLLAGWLETERITHLHTHFGTNSTTVAMLANALGGPRFSFTVHGPEEFDKPTFIALPEKIRRSAFVVAVSSFGRSQLLRLTPHASWDKIKVVHCGLDQAFGAGAPDQPGAARRLVCVGRLCEQKGQLLLLEAARRLRDRGVAFELVLAGDGEMRGEIEAQIAAFALGGIVRVTGWIGGEQVRDEILAARALVLASFAEGLPVVIMEAMALRRPVISTFVAGIPELVRDGVHGWLVPAGDVDALVEAMQSCLDAPTDDVARMGTAACARVRARHNIDAEADKLIELFQAAEAGAVG
ncbi:MAG: glycosyltransferase [Xanthobacteraceae bacterium]|nr:glycosyltransferase [Xanthobacteraceae bacterium]